MIGLFFLIGLIVLVGFTGNILFCRTRIPESIFLMLIGVIVGPVLHIINPGELIGISAYIANFALIIILLENGLSMNIFRILKNFRNALVFILLVFLLSTVLVSAFLHMVMGWNILYALLLGVISSGTTTITVMSIAERFNASGDTKSLLLLESTINDLTLITGAVIIVIVIKSQIINFSQISNSIIGGFSTAFVFGTLSAIIWVWILNKYLEKNPLNYFSTLGVLLILYDTVEISGGSGPIAALVFSLTVGHLHDVIRRLNIKTSLVSEHSLETLKKIRTLQMGITFFVKTFFFVFLGIIFNFRNLSREVWTISFGMIVLLLLARYISVRVLLKLDRRYQRDHLLIAVMLPRGFVATILVFLPLTGGVSIPMLTEIVLLMIFLSTFTAIVGASVFGKPTADYSTLKTSNRLSKAGEEATDQTAYNPPPSCGK